MNVNEYFNEELEMFKVIRLITHGYIVVKIPTKYIKHTTYEDNIRGITEVQYDLDVDIDNLDEIVLPTKYLNRYERKKSFNEDHLRKYRYKFESVIKPLFTYYNIVDMILI